MLLLLLPIDFESTRKRKKKKEIALLLNRFEFPFFVPIRMTGGSAETHWMRKAMAKRQVKERLFHLGGRAEEAK